MFEAIPLVMGLAGAVGKIFSRHRANKELGRLGQQDPSYQINPLAKQRLSLAQSLLNAKMPGSAQLERNIYGNQANTLGAINRYATSGSQALARATAAQGETNNQFQNLGIEQLQDYQRRYGNYVGAEEGMINEGDKLFNDQTRRWNDQLQIKGAQAQNRAANWGDVSNLGFGLTSFGLGGGFDKIFGNMGGGGNGSYNPMSAGVQPPQSSIYNPQFLSPSFTLGNSLPNFWQYPKPQ